MSEFETDRDIAEAMDWSAGEQPDISETLQQMHGPGVTYTYTVVPVSAELAEDAAGMADVQAVILRELGRQLERELYPWRFPDPNPMPVMVLFPLVARVEGWAEGRRVRLKAS